MNRNPGDVRLSPQYNAILLISGRNLQESDMRRIGKAARTVVKEYDRSSIAFIGSCFGHYDVVMEIATRSARVLSNCACAIQEAIETFIKKDRGQVQGRGAVCSSLVIGNEIVRGGVSKPRRQYEFPIRAYTFMRPQSSVQLATLVKHLQGNAHLLWNPSIFSILMVSDGTSYRRIFRQILDHRHRMKREIAESSTLFGLRFDSASGFKGTKGEDDEGEVTAAVTIKLRGHVGAEDIVSILENTESGWCPMLGGDFGPVFRRAGGSDYVLGIVTPNLAELRERTFELRKALGERISTSTVLLLPSDVI